MDENPTKIRIPVDEVKQNVPELAHNPFADRICYVFSSAKDGYMTFEDFLDMASVMSSNSPAEVKADWAFKVFGL